MHLTSFALLLTLPMLGSLVAAQDPGADAAAVRRKALGEAGIGTPLTLYPVRVLGRPSSEVADALGLVLEHSGMAELQVAERAFDPAGADWDAVPALFAAHVRQEKAAPDAAPRHSLYAEYLGEPRRGPTEVRFVLVDSAGELVLSDRQTPADAAFKRTAGRDPDPLGCSTLVGERLFELAGWTKAPGTVRDGKFSQRWRAKSGVPDQAELAAMAERRTALQGDLAAARIAVLPTLAAGAHDAASAKRLAELVAAKLGCTATAAAEDAALTVVRSSNEQKRLWDLARALRAALAKTAVDADYALVADVAVAPDGKRGYVHVVLATRSGDIVLADFQNDQHPMFQEHAPKSIADAEQLAAARLARLLR